MGPRGEPGVAGPMGPPGPQGPNGLSLPGEPVSLSDTILSFFADMNVENPLTTPVSGIYSERLLNKKKKKAHQLFPPSQHDCFFIFLTCRCSCQNMTSITDHKG